MMVFQSITMVDGSGNVTFGLRHGGKYFIALGKDVKAPTFLCGDVDGNGVVETADALLALRGAMGIAALTPEQAERADMDGNGVVDTVDALAILRRAILNG